MPLLNGSQFAKLIGVSRQAISKLLSQDKLKKSGTKFDTENPVNRAYIEYRKKVVPPSGKTFESKKKPAVKKGAALNKKKPNKNNKLNTQKKAFAPAGKKKDIEAEIDLSLISEIGSLPRGDLERYKLISAIDTQNVKTSEIRKDLISRSLVERVFAKLYSIDSNQYKNLGMNLAPAIAAETGTDSPEITIKINELIDKELYAILSHKKRIVNDFLEEIGAEKN